MYIMDKNMSDIDDDTPNNRRVHVTFSPWEYEQLERNVKSGRYRTIPEQVHEIVTDSLKAVRRI